MTTPVWVPKGLITITKLNAMSQILKNIAYLVERELQIDDVTVDPSYDLRTSVNKKMVSLSNPPTTNPVYPVAVVSFVSFTGYAMALNPVRYDYTVQIMLVGQKSQESVLEKQITLLNAMMQDDREADLFPVGMHYVRDSIPSSFTPFRRDADDPKLIVGTISYSFYSIV